MTKLDYRWGKGPCGQYVNGHERDDVVAYHQKTFLPAFLASDSWAHQWTNGGPAISATPITEWPMVYWYHDESVFSAHDRQKVYWVPKDAKATPEAKGEGATLMVADFVSADHGFLQSPDGKESTRVLFHPGKNKDGYFTNDEILDQATHAMDILSHHYPDEDHVFIFDNATTHLKRAPDALSAWRMSKNPTAPDQPMFGVDVPVRGLNGKPVYGPDGKILRERVRMANAQFSNGSPQSLYYPDGHERAGVFKGMAEILTKRGYDAAAVRNLPAQCPKFSCPVSPPPGKLSCCCWRLLYNEPVTGVESLLESHCKARGFSVIFLPKFHCELNPIEACWGFARRCYHEMPPSTGKGAEADLEKNVIKALNMIPLESIRR